MTDLNTLLTGPYVKIDDYLGKHSRSARPLKLTDAELLTLAVAQVLFGFRSEARWLRFVAPRPARRVLLSAAPVGLQQAATERPAADQATDSNTDHRHRPWG